MKTFLYIAFAYLFFGFAAHSHADEPSTFEPLPLGLTETGYYYFDLHQCDANGCHSMSRDLYMDREQLQALKIYIRPEHESIYCREGEDICYLNNGVFVGVRRGEPCNDPHP